METDASQVETDDETDTDEPDILEILVNISLSFNPLKELREQYMKT